MGQLLHGTATTTHAVREKIQNAEGSLAKLAKHYGI
ncbi:MAG: IS481 family transposase, partial [Methylovulum sp.]|nr:IS481 family transposase [Methylovulum sp.]